MSLYRTPTQYKISLPNPSSTQISHGWFYHNLFLSYPIVLKFCNNNDAATALRYANAQNITHTFLKFNGATAEDDIIYPLQTSTVQPLMFGTDKSFHSTFHWPCDYLSMLELKLNQWVHQVDVMDEKNAARYEFKNRFGRIFYITIILDENTLFIGIVSKSRH